MNKKLQSLILGGIIAVNTLAPIAPVFADSKLGIDNDTKIERRSLENEVTDDSICPPESEWQKTSTQEDLDRLWEYTKETKADGEEVILLKKYIGASENTKVEIPREIEGKKVELENLRSEIFPGVTHIKVADGNESNKVKLRATWLAQGFSDDDDIVYADFSGIETSGGCHMHMFFSYCDNLRYADLSGWNITESSIITYMFYYAPKLEVLNLSGWNIPSSLSTTGFFTACRNIKKLIIRNLQGKESYDKIKGMTFGGLTDNSTLDITGLKLTDQDTSLNGMFSNNKISRIIGLETLNTENVLSMSGMFSDCSKITDLSGISNWHVSKLQNIDNMFKNCSALESLDLSNWNTTSLNSANTTFTSCSSLTTLDLSGFNMDNVTQAPWMFQDCSSLREIKGTESWTLNKVQRAVNMFKGCSNLNLINLSNLDIPSGADITGMFRLDSGADNEHRKLLVITNDDEVKHYDFEGSNRLPVKVTLNSNRGKFVSDENQETTVKTKERYYIEPSKYNDINQTIKEDLQGLGTPTRNGYQFIGWEMSKTPTSKFDMLDMSYSAKWDIIQDSDGNVTIPSTGGENIVIKPNENGDAPTYSNDGNINIPSGGAIELPSGSETIKTPQGAILNTDNGEIILPNGGSLDLSNGNSIKIPNNGSVSEDGIITVPENSENVVLPGDIEVQMPGGGTINTDNGNIELSNESILTLPNDIVVEVPENSIMTSEGNIETTGGTTITPNGVVTVSGTTIQLHSGEENVVSIDEQGNVTIPQSENVVLPGGTEVIIPGGSTITTEGSIITLNNNVAIKQNGSITIKGENSESSITIPPITNGNTVVVPLVDENGDVRLPNVGKVELPNGGSIVIPQNTLVKPNGEIIIPDDADANITIPQENGNNVVIKPSTQSEVPKINNEGNITIPSGSEVKLLGGSTITAQGGTANLKTGEVALQNGGSLDLSNYNGTIQLPNEAIVSPSGDIIIPSDSQLILPNVGEDNHNIVIKPNEGGKVATIDKNGNIVTPENGKVELPDVGEVVLPQGSIVKQDGSIIVQEGGAVTLPNNSEIVTVEPGTIINPDGTIKNTQTEAKPSVLDKIDKEVVDIVGNGDGQANNPITLTVKDVDKTKLNTFLNNLKELNPKVTDISKNNNNIEYKLEVDNNNSLSKAIEKTYLTIKVDNNKTDLIKALNKFSKGTNEKVEIPIITSFTDTIKHWAKANIESFASMGIINGYDDGTFKPDAPITRAEFVKIINNAFGYTKRGTVTFTDVKKGDWFYNEVAIAKQAGYINGKTETTFAPNDKITRQEVAKILTTIMKNKNTNYDELKKFPDGNKVSEWAKPYVEGAIKAGYLSGDTSGKLNPTNNITRAEAVTVLSRLK